MDKQTKEIKKIKEDLIEILDAFDRELEKITQPQKPGTIEIADASHGEVELAIAKVQWLVVDDGASPPLRSFFATKLDAMLHIKHEIETLNKFYDEHDNYKKFKLIPVATYEGQPYQWDEYELKELISDEIEATKKNHNNNKGE